jgi:hypothetical protein
MVAMVLLGLWASPGLFVPMKNSVDVAFRQHAAMPKQQLDTAFLDALHEQQKQAQALQRQVNRLAHPDVPLRLIWEGKAQRAVIKGSATTDSLRMQAIRLHGLDGHQQLKFILHGSTLNMGIAISESRLANTQDLDVHITPLGRVSKSGSASWWQ